jgi:hypothetical protein
MISEGQADVDQILQTSKDIKQLREGGTLSDEKVRSLDEPEVQAYYEANPTCLDDIMNLPDWTLLALARDSGIANPDETAKEINWVGRTFTYEQIKNFTHVQCLAVCNEGIQKILQKCPTPESMVEKLNSITSEVVPDDWNLDPWFGLTLAGRVNN